MDARGEAPLQAVLERPYDDPPRLAYARWLEERRADDPYARLRAEFIRLQVKLARESFAGGAPVEDEDAELLRRVRWLEDVERERELREAHGPRWAEPVAHLVSDYHWERGFVAGVTLPAAAFLDYAPRLFARAPIVFVRLTQVREAGEALFFSPLLGRVPALSLADTGIGDQEVRRLAESPHLARLWWLDLSFNRVGPEGTRALAASPRLRRLPFIGLDGNPANPRETIGVDGYLIQDASLPPEGEALEAEFGSLPWLRHPTLSTLDYPPSPYGPPPVPAGPLSLTRRLRAPPHPPPPAGGAQPRAPAWRPGRAQGRRGGPPPSASLPAPRNPAPATPPARRRRPRRAPTGCPRPSPGPPPRGPAHGAPRGEARPRAGGSARPGGGPGAPRNRRASRRRAPPSVRRG